MKMRGRHCVRSVCQLQTQRTECGLCKQSQVLTLLSAYVHGTPETWPLFGKAKLILLTIKTQFGIHCCQNAAILNNPSERKCRDESTVSPVSNSSIGGGCLGVCISHPPVFRNLAEARLVEPALPDSLIPSPPSDVLVSLSYRLILTPVHTLLLTFTSHPSSAPSPCRSIQQAGARHLHTSTPLTHRPAYNRISGILRIHGYLRITPRHSHPDLSSTASHHDRNSLVCDLHQLADRVRLRYSILIAIVTLQAGTASFYS
ncbi:hypothetical protein PHBOTO_005573 [Pseudozyma hubeiensis]|nr:hypothetical protein PHBOTO_005573 [Pseudozyma hubeiensis]